MIVENPASQAGNALSKAIFGNSYFSTVVSCLGDHRSDPVTVHLVAKATHLADAIVKPIFLRLVESGALVPLESATSARSFSIDGDALEPVANIATWIETKVELDLADVETRLWELAERDLDGDGVQVLRKLATRVPTERRLSWLANAIADTTTASPREVDEIVRDRSR